MPISRTKKEELVALYSDLIAEASALVFTDSTGTSVGQMQTLRRRLRTVDARFMIVKNRLLRIALEAAGVDATSETFTGPMSVLFTSDDIGSSVTELKSFVREDLPNNHPFRITGGVLGRQVLDADAAADLSSLPTMAEIQAKLLGTLGAPSRDLVRMVDAVPHAVYRTLGAPARDLGAVLLAHSQS